MTAGSTPAERFAEILARVEQASARVARDPAGVRIVAVAKTFGPDAVREAAACGVTVIGENRVQEAAQKIPLCPEHLEWHMIGHLQRNKVKHAVGLFRMIHSVDSPRLITTLDEAAGDLGIVMPVCIEVNVSGESSKFGMSPEEVPGLLEEARGLVHVEVRGLMTIPPFTPDPEGARPFFARLRELRDEWRESIGLPLDELSMGMSHDFEVAVEEGATWIRVGAALFGSPSGKRPPQAAAGE